MQQADDLALSSKWSITFHDPKSPELYASSLGAFNTISGFWRIYRAMLDNKILTNLPVTVNISVYRESAQQCTKPWHGEWNIDLHHDTNPMRIYQQIILLAIGEQLTSQIRGLVLERRRDPMHQRKTHFSLSIFTDVKDPDLDLKNVLLTNNVISLDHCVSGKVTFRPFQLLHIPTQNGNDEEQKDEEVIDSHIPCIKYSMASLLKYKKSINRPRSSGVSPRDTKHQHANGHRNGHSNGSQLNSNHNVNTFGHHAPSQNAQNPKCQPLKAGTRHNRANSRATRRAPPKPILPGFKHRDSVLRLFGSQCTSYTLNVVNVHDIITENLQSILLSEGCIVCMGTTLQSPYAQDLENASRDGSSQLSSDTVSIGSSIHDEEQKTLSPNSLQNDGTPHIHSLADLLTTEYRESFLVAECSTLKCKHVAHCECIVKAVNHISIRNAHCSQFFNTVELSSLSNPEIQKEIGYHINTDNVTGKIYNFSFRINHLISHNSKVSPQWPITVPSYYHNQNGVDNPGAGPKEECLQIFFDNTELQIRRGTLQIAIAETKMEGVVQSALTGIVGTEDLSSERNAVLHTVNFEIPPPPEGLDVDPKITNKIYQLRYVDPATQQVLVVNINMKLKPNYALQLLSLRYEFNHHKTADIQPSEASEVASRPGALADNESYISSLSNLSASPLSISLLNLPNPLMSPTPLLSPASLMGSAVSFGMPVGSTGVGTVGSAAAATPMNSGIGLQSVPLTRASSASPSVFDTGSVGPIGGGLPQIGVDQLGGVQMAMASLNMQPITHLPVLAALGPISGGTVPLAIPIMPMDPNHNIPTMPTAPPAAARNDIDADHPVAMIHLNDPNVHSLNGAASPTPITSHISGHITGNITGSSPSPRSASPPSSSMDPGLPVNLDNPMELYYYVCTEFGTKYICDKLQNPLYFTLFFEKLKNFYPLLMMHHLGHTVCRVIYSQRHCTMRHKLVFLQTLALSFTKIASNRQGSFALICILSLMTTDSELQIISSAFKRIVACGPNGENDEQFDEIILSQSGYHVIKKLVSFGHPHFDCILKGIATDFSKYATHHYGVPIIRSILDLIAADEALIRRYRKSLLLFAQHATVLVCNQYGNYVMQQLLEISPSAVTDVIKERMRGKFSTLAKHKFASNVVEKTLKHSLDELKGVPFSPRRKQEGGGNPHGIRIHNPRVKIVDHEQKDEEGPRTIWVQRMVRELLLNAKELINHKFGNYCLQTALTVAIEAEPFMKNGNGQRLLRDFVDTVTPLLACLRQNVRKKWHQLLLSASHNGYNDRQWNGKQRRGDGRDRRYSDRATFHHHY